MAGPAASSVSALAGLTTVVMVLMLGQCTRAVRHVCDGSAAAIGQDGSCGTPVRVTVLVAVLVATTASVFRRKPGDGSTFGTLFAFIVSAG